VVDLLALGVFIAEAINTGWPDNTHPRTDAEFVSFYGGEYRRDNWRYLDIWSGASTDAGMMVVFDDDQPVWTCTYRGGILPASAQLGQTNIAENELFAFLIQALRATPAHPSGLRGPSSFDSRDGRWSYVFKMVGWLDSFFAAEQISDGGVLSYERLLIGGLVGDGIAYGSASILDRLGGSTWR
jgi:hypothetical protein